MGKWSPKSFFPYDWESLAAKLLFWLQDRRCKPMKPRRAALVLPSGGFIGFHPGGAPFPCLFPQQEEGIVENPSGIFYNSSKIRLRDWSYSSRVTSPFWYKSSSRRSLSSGEWIEAFPWGKSSSTTIVWVATPSVKIH